jgi:hypothetical protein
VESAADKFDVVVDFPMPPFPYIAICLIFFAIVVSFLICAPVATKERAYAGA